MKYSILLSLILLIGFTAFSQDSSRIASVNYNKRIELSDLLVGRIGGSIIDFSAYQKSETNIPLVRVRCGTSASYNNTPLYLVDGDYVKDISDVSIDSITDITVLRNSESIAIFGTMGINGAIIITTKKTGLFKQKTLDTLKIASSPTCILRWKTSCSTLNFTNDTTGVHNLEGVANISRKLKIYPNPVQRGNVFTLSLKLKQAGNYNVQIVDAGGRVVLQKQIYAAAKEFIDQVQTDSRWSGGVYFIRVVDSNNKLISTSNLILQ